MKNRNPSIVILLATLGMSAASAQADAPKYVRLSSLTEQAGQAGKPDVQAFSLKEVRLLDGPFHDAMELDKAYLLSLDPDRLLHTFRLTAGLPTSAKPYGGWESPGCELRGHSLGHYLSACALMYASTGDEKLKARVDRIVAELAKCQEALPAKGYNQGFLSAYPERSSTASMPASRFGPPITRCTRSWPACSTPTSSAATRRPWKC